jgi:hypothetical protein
VLTSLLVTVMSQVTAAASSTPANQTEAGGPTITNPTSSPSSSSSSSDSIVSSHLKTKLGVGIAVGAAVFILLVVEGIFSRRNARVAYSSYSGQYDEYRNLVPGYRAGYERYRRAGGNPDGNNVTVNVVHGDMQH